jgi:RNA polymerase sigma-70 factor (ECF subfamily)
MPDEPEVHGLLALMLLHDARRDARFAAGELVLLADQDRSLWHGRQLDEGRLLLDRALALQGHGPYVLQAAITALHTDDVPDYAEIAALYAELARITGSPVVEVNRAVAVAEADGAEAGLDLLERVDLDGYRYFHAARAELLQRVGRDEEAAAEFDRAIALTPEGPELRHLRRRLAEVAPR